MADAVKIVTKEKAMAVNAIINEAEIDEVNDDFCLIYDYFGFAYDKEITKEKIIKPSYNAKKFLLGILKKSPNYIGKGRVKIDTVLERKVDYDLWDECKFWLVRNAHDINTNYLPYIRALNAYVYRKGADSNYIEDEADIAGLNQVAERCGLNVRAKANQKFTKVITAFAKEIGLDKITDIRDVSFTDNDGNFHERKKDFGWKKIQAEIGDALNILEVKSPMYISVNSKDISTMSCGDSWSSCHFVGAGEEWNGNDSYSGCYSGGNIGYIRDGVTFVVFTTKDGVDADDWLKGKTHRAVFAFENGVLYEGRVYPDGRDGGDETIAGTMRNAVQKLIADGLGENNIWTIKKGARSTSSHVRAAEGYCGYKDWLSCEDGNMSFLQTETTDMDHVIEIGTYAVCPSCGRQHTNSKCALCERCWENIVCNNCGEGIDTECDDYIEYAGNYYCCSRCAERAGLCYADDLDEWTSEEYCRQDACTDRWYYYYDDGIFTVDGNWFHSDETAEESGYRYAEDKGEWYSEDRLYRDSYDEYYYYDESEKVVVGDKTYHNYDNAIRDGWSEEDIELGREAV